MSLVISRVFDNVFSASVLLLVLAYPILMYNGINRFSAAQFGWLIMAIFIARFIVIKEARQARQWPVLVAVVIFCCFVINSNNDKLLYYYPVLMSTGFAILFFCSLKGETSLIEQFLRASGKAPPEHATSYLRGLSLAWGVFLLINAAISAYSACCTSPFFWALYNGLISYIAIATFVIAELIYRRHYKKKNGIIDE